MFLEGDLMQKKELTEKMWKEIVNDFPKPVIYYWIANSSKPIEVLLTYAIGFHDGWTTFSK